MMKFEVSSVGYEEAITINPKEYSLLLEIAIFNHWVNQIIWKVLNYIININTKIIYSLHCFAEKQCN